MTASAHENLDERLLHRMLFFTDAVFAIVLTLLALELRPPEGPLTAASLVALSGHVAAFAMSFVLTGVFWIAHMSTMRRLERFDWPSAWANIAYLFPICLLPFASSWFGRSINGAFAWGVYSSVLVMSSVANVVLVLVTKRGRGRLITGGVTRQELVFRLVRAASAGIAFGVGLLLVAAGQLGLAHFCWVLIPVVLLLADRFLKPEDGAQASG